MQTSTGFASETVTGRITGDSVGSRVHLSKKMMEMEMMMILMLTTMMMMMMMNH